MIPQVFGLSRFSGRTLIKAAAMGAALCVLPPAGVLVFSEGPKLLESFRRLSPGLFALSLFMVFTAWMCHSLRVYFMVRTLGYRSSWGYAIVTAMAMEFGIAVTPGGVGGGALKAAFLGRLGMPIGESLGLIATDVLFDGVFLVLAGAAGVWAVFHDPWWQNMVAALSLHRVPVGLFGVIGVMFGVFLMGLRWARKSRMGYKGTRRCTNEAGDLESGRGVFGRLGKTLGRGCLVAPRLFQKNAGVAGLCVFLALVQGFCRYGILPLLVSSFDPGVAVLPLVPLQALVWALSLVLVLPGGGGSVEIISLVFLRSMLPMERVAVVVLGWRFLTYHLNWIIGAVSLLCASTHSFSGSRKSEPF